MKKVYIVWLDGLVLKMFLARGWEETSLIEEADLVQFTGGSDVSPRLYGESSHPHTYSDLGRDKTEEKVFKQAELLGVPMAGICRGGQFLNVMNGGKMWQHVNNHAIGGTHLLVDKDSEQVYSVTSTHHQIMNPHADGLVVAVAEESTYKEHMYKDEMVKIVGGSEADVEVVYYGETNALCFQPHPEYVGKDTEFQQWYFDLLNDYLGVSGV